MSCNQLNEDGLCWAGVYPLPTGRIQCETPNDFTPTLDDLLQLSNISLVN